DHEFSGEAGVPACSAGDDADFVELAELLFGEAEIAEINFAGVARNAAEKCVANGARLLEDFLLHAMVVAALFRHDGIPGDMVRFALDGLAGMIHHADAGLGEDSDVAIGKEENVACVLEQSGDIARDKEFVFAKTNHGGWTHAGSDDLV